MQARRWDWVCEIPTRCRPDLSSNRVGPPRSTRWRAQDATTGWLGASSAASVHFRRDGPMVARRDPLATLATQGHDCRRPASRGDTVSHLAWSGQD